jgi:coiled-coil and C2 domain-containing protein 2A
MIEFMIQSKNKSHFTKQELESS